MLFFRTKKQTATKVATGVKVKSSVTPENRPTFNEWCNDFKVGSLYSYYTPMPHNGVVLQQN
jgi:hypothetical protein